MSAQLAAAELFLLAFATFAVLARVVCAWLAPGTMDRVQGWDPSRRHVALLLIAAAPLLLTLALFLAVLLPSVLALFVPALDHCLAHDDGHAHLCFVHWPHHAPHVAIWAALASLLTFGAFTAGSALVQLGSSLRVARGLLRTSLTHADGVHLLESKTPFCATVGLFRPKILVSHSLLDALSENEQQALIAHEQSHARRRDSLSRVLCRALSLMYPRDFRVRLAIALDLAAEQACDEAAAGMVGDRLTVASAIVHAEQTLGRFAPTDLGLVAVGLGGMAVEQRVQALLAPPRVGGWLGTWMASAMVLFTLLFISADSLHHAVESLLSPLLQ